ncbi:LysR family transcriptional regulator [Stakelama sediminis]|uniref:DNA-binding transcriptional LysR family regulator n=1 Tax=Stakelama sediminis TaxID=463200 RepID=A0A840YXG5_9SPHN|nr:LysR family transcriptional regulator [Stakelama sediminis]MBB5718226.1 DNA-binding transcriptional LysR family regulator [Stakelama sediminis]
MIDRYLLRYFLAVIDQGNFSRAASACSVSQPTLSVGIAKLETEVGQALFLRTNRRTELTAAGVRFAEHARRIEQEFALAEQAARGAMQTNIVRLGILSTIPLALVQRALNVTSGQSIQIEVVFEAERRLLAHLDRGRLDAVLGLVRADSPGGSLALFEEGYRLAMPPGHPLAKRASVAPEELADNAMIVRRHCEVLSQTSRHFTAHGVRPFMAARVTSDTQALACVRAGLGVTVMPASYCGEGVAMPRLAGFDPVRTIGILHGARTAAQELSDSLTAIGTALCAAYADTIP